MLRSSILYWLLFMPFVQQDDVHLKTKQNARQSRTKEKLDKRIRFSGEGSANNLSFVHEISVKMSDNSNEYFEVS